MTDYINELKNKYTVFLEIISDILGTNLSDDTKTIISVDNAYKAICKYCGWNDIPEKYTNAVVTLAIAYYHNQKISANAANGNYAVASITQGSRSISYANSNTVSFNEYGITDEVIAMLPYPKLKVI